MDLGLGDRVALIGGSSRGIGAAIAEALVQEGARVVVTGRHDEAVSARAALLSSHSAAERVLGHVGDLASAEVAAAAVEAAVGRWGRVDCVVASAGSGASASGSLVGLSEWQSAFAANLWPAVTLVEAALPRLQEGASVVLVGSIAGVESTDAPMAYAAAKAAIVSYTGSLARELGPRGIRVNCVAPGNVVFPGGRWQERLDSDPQGVRAIIERDVPLGRFGEPPEIASLVAYLLSSKASFVTGACVIADGGQTRSM